MLTSNEFTIFVDFILHFFLLKGILNYVLTVEQTSQPVGNTHLIIPPYYVAICYLYMSNMYAHIHLILICFFQHSFWNHTMQTNWFKVGIATSLKSSSNTQPLYPSLSFWSLQVILFITLRICNRCLTPRFLDISFSAINSSLEMSHSIIIIIIICFYATWCHSAVILCYSSDITPIKHVVFVVRQKLTGGVRERCNFFQMS